MTAPESFAELAELFDRGWRIATLAVDVREERAFVRISLEHLKCEGCGQAGRCACERWRAQKTPGS